MVLFIFKKGPFEEVNIDIGTKNNYFKSIIPTITIFCVTNIRQIQKNTEKDILNCVEMKILAQVNCIKDASESEIEQTKNKVSNSDFCYCTFPIYERSKLLGVDKKICMISVLGDPGVSFFTNGFHDADESKPLWLGQRRQKILKPFTCTVPSFMKQPIKNGVYNKEDCSLSTVLLLNYVIELKKKLEPRTTICTFHTNSRGIFRKRF